jgi:rhodanese-related sulfurtransferase
MIVASITILIAVLSLLVVVVVQRTRDRHVIEQHTITPEALHALLVSNPEVLLFDVRQPLDLLADSEIIPGAKRISPKEVLENPSLIPHEKDSIIYCTSPSNKTTLRILRRALALHLTRIKLLKGGLDGWKKKGYPVEPYTKPFHLDTDSPDLHNSQSGP